MEDPEPQLVDFSRLPGQLQSVAGVVGALALVGCLVDGALNGLTFALIGRWFGIFVIGLVLGTAVLTAAHALGGADRAGRRGDRLSSPDVGLSPRRLSAVEDQRDDLGGEVADPQGEVGDPQGGSAADPPPARSEEEG